MSLSIDIMRVASEVRGMVRLSLSLTRSTLAQNPQHGTVIAAAFGAAVLVGGNARFILKSSGELRVSSSLAAGGQH